MRLTKEEIEAVKEWAHNASEARHGTEPFGIRLQDAVDALKRAEEGE